PSPPQLYTLSYTTLFRSAPQMRDPSSFWKKPGSRVCSASLRYASCCAAPGTPAARSRRLRHGVHFRRIERVGGIAELAGDGDLADRKSTRLNSSHRTISY